jgi:hypothetical protein
VKDFAGASAAEVMTFTNALLQNKALVATQKHACARIVRNACEKLTALHPEHGDVGTMQAMRNALDTLHLS